MSDNKRRGTSGDRGVTIAAIGFALSLIWVIFFAGHPDPCEGLEGFARDDCYRQQYLQDIRDSRRGN